MTPAQIEAVRDSWAKVEPLGIQAARLFYARLFEVAPDTRRMFGADIDAQSHKLLAVLGTAVAGLDRIEALLPVLRQLGARHVAYGVHAEHYAIVGQVLLWTLERGLQDHYTPAVSAAWQAVWTAIATTMQEGAQQALAPC
jgi:hemoglobin-like flavoprotein